MFQVTIYQIEANKMQELYGDPRGAHENWKMRKKFYPYQFDEVGNLKMDAYSVVFDLDLHGFSYFSDIVQAPTVFQALEELFKRFNTPMDRDVLRDHYGFKGASLTCGDVVRIQRDDKHMPLNWTYDMFWYCDSFDWRLITPVNVPLPFVVGDGVTIIRGSDRYPAFISRISPTGKTIWIKRAQYKRTDKNTFSDHQEYEITPDDTMPEERVRYSRKYKRWQLDAFTPVSLNGAQVYWDPTL